MKIINGLISALLLLLAFNSVTWAAESIIMRDYILDLPAATSMSDNDIFMIVDDPAGTPVTKKIARSDTGLTVGPASATSGYSVCFDGTTGKLLKECTSPGGTPTVITVADTTDATAFVALFESATGDLGPKTDAGLTYNATTGMLTATGFTGPLTGNVTGSSGSTTGNAATASALTADPAGCTGGQVTTDINASGVSSCTSWTANVLTLMGAPTFAAFKASLTLDNVTNESKATMFTSPTFTGKATTAASAAVAGAGFNIPHGVAPNSPVNGDCWSTTAGLYCYINGSVVGPFATASGGVSLDAIINPTGAKTFTLLDNNASALSFGSTGKADILKIITTDAGEGVSMSGTLGVTGTITGNLTGNVTGNVSGSSGSTTGNAATATTAAAATATAITNDTTTAATMYPTWVTANTGNLPQKVSSTKLTFLPSTGMLTSTGFTGELTGNASTATALATNPANCAAGEIALGINAAGVAECTATPSGLTSVGATTFSGALTGVASGNVPNTLYDAYSILMATDDNTPVALTVGAQTLVGRKTGGAIAALSGADALLAMGITPLITELNYVDGVTSPIQTQLDAMIPKSTIVAAGDVVVGTGAATPGVITKGVNNSIFSVSNAGVSGYFTNITPVLVAAPPVDNTYSGTGVTFVAGETLLQWDIVYCKNKAGVSACYKYDANGADKAEPPRAVATAAITADAAGVFCIGDCIVRHDSWTAGQAGATNTDEGKRVYASNTPGEITITEPATDGVVVGTLIEEKVVHFKFKNDGASVGSGAPVKANTPTLITPVIGAATGTSLMATGRVDGTVGMLISTAASPTTIVVATHGNASYFMNIGNSAANSIFTLPTAAAGLQYCAKNYTGITTVLKFQTSAAGQYIDLDGVNTATGGLIKSAGAAGDGACVVGVDATHWVAFPHSGTWTKD